MGQPFQFPLNVVNVAAATGGGPKLPTGYYRARVVEMEPKEASTGRVQIMYRVEITDAAYAGVPRTGRLNLPDATNPKDKAPLFWRAALESAGYTAAQLDAGPVTISGGVFIGRDVFVHYEAGDQDAGTRDQLNMVTPAVFDAGKAAESANGGGGAVATPTTGLSGLGGLGGGSHLGGGGGMLGAGGLGGGLSTATSGGLGAPAGLSGGLGSGLGGLGGLGASAGVGLPNGSGSPLTAGGLLAQLNGGR